MARVLACTGEERARCFLLELFRAFAQTAVQRNVVRNVYWHTVREFALSCVSALLKLSILLHKMQVLRV